MPANLTPQYQKAELAYRRAQTAVDQEACLLKMLQLIPKHKGTERLQADLKTRLREVRIQQQEAEAANRSGPSFRIARQGAGRVVIIGPPNCGKSRLLKELTRATPEVSPWPFTTRDPSPGMLILNDVSVQLIDTPPIAVGHLEPWLLNLIRTADAVLLVFHGGDDDAPAHTLNVLQELNRRKTRLTVVGGFDESNFAVLRIKTQIVVTHAHEPEWPLRIAMLKELGEPFEPFVGLLPNVQSVSLDCADSRLKLADAVFKLLGVIRVYTRKPGEPTARSAPVTIPEGGTVEDLALELHQELFERLVSARVWSPDGKRDGHEGRTVGRHFVLHDGDTVELNAG